MAFSDAYERTIDDKNRIQIPAQFRAELDSEIHGKALYLCPGEQANTLSLYPQRTFERIAEQLCAEPSSDDDALAFEQLYYSLASKLDWDKQGRVVLPSRQLSLVDLGKEVTLTGWNTRIDIWRTADYEAFVRERYATQRRALHKVMREALARSTRSDSRS